MRSSPFAPAPFSHIVSWSILGSGRLTNPPTPTPTLWVLAITGREMREKDG